MIYICQANSADYRKKYKLDQLLNLLPFSLHGRAKRYEFEVDAFNFVLGRLLLKEGLDQLGLVTNLESITYGENGKPFLKKAYFNISHSEDRVICALSTEGEIGIDIEKERTLELKSFLYWFSLEEWTNIQYSDSPLKTFFWYWTRKESILKALGIELSHLHKIEINPTNDFFFYNQEKWHLQDLNLGKGYFGAICSEEEIGTIKIDNYSWP